MRVCVCVWVRAAYKVRVTSYSVEGDFLTYTATVVEVLKNSDKGQVTSSRARRHARPPWPPPPVTSLRCCLAELEAVSSGTQVELVKRATCTSVEVREGQQYLLMGSRGSQSRLEHSLRCPSSSFSSSPPPPPCPHPLLCVQVPPPSGLGGPAGALALSL